jgi:hypothetical protein
MLVSNTWIMPLYYYLFAWEMDIQLCVCTLCRLLFKHQVAPRNCRCCKKFYHELRWVATHLRKPDLITWCKGESLEANDTSNKQQKIGILFQSCCFGIRNFPAGGPAALQCLKAELDDLQWTKSGTTVKKQQCQMIWGVGWGAESQGRIPMPCNSFTSFFLFPLKKKMSSTYLELPEFGWFNP